MEHNQREFRRIAATKFLESLDQLQTTLEAAENQALDLPILDDEAGAPKPQSTLKTDLVRRSQQPPINKTPPANRSTVTRLQSRSRPVNNKFTFQELEMAVADIEQYMNRHQANVTGAQPNWEA